MTKIKFKPASKENNQPDPGPIDANRTRDSSSTLHTILQDDSLRKWALNKLDGSEHSERWSVGYTWAALFLVAVGGLVLFGHLIPVTGHEVQGDGSKIAIAAALYGDVLDSPLIQVSVVAAVTAGPAVFLGRKLHPWNVSSHLTPTLDTGVRVFTTVTADGEATHVIETSEKVPEERLRSIVDALYEGGCRSASADNWTPPNPRSEAGNDDLELVTAKITFNENESRDAFCKGMTVEDLEERFEDKGLQPDEVAELLTKYDLQGTLIVDLSPRANQTGIKHRLQDRNRTSPEATPEQAQTTEQHQRRPEKSAAAQDRDEDLAAVKADQIYDLTITIVIFAPSEQVASAKDVINGMQGFLNEMVPDAVEVSAKIGTTASRLRVLSRRRAKQHLHRMMAGTPGAEYTHPKRALNTIIRQPRVNYPVDPDELPIYVLPSNNGDYGTTPVPNESLPPDSQVDDLSDRLGIAPAEGESRPGEPAAHTDPSADPVTDSPTDSDTATRE